MAKFKRNNIINSHFKFKPLQEQDEKEKDQEPEVANPPKHEAASGLDVYLRTKASDFIDANVGNVADILASINSASEAARKATSVKSEKLQDSLKTLYNSLVKNRTQNTSKFPSKTVTLGNITHYSFTDLVEDVKTSIDKLEGEIPETAKKAFSRLEKKLDLAVEAFKEDLRVSTNKSEFTKKKNKLTASHNRMVVNIPPENLDLSKISVPSLTDFASHSRDLKSNLEALDKYVSVVNMRVSSYLTKQGSKAAGFFTDRSSEALSCERLKACLSLLSDASFDAFKENETLIELISASESNVYTKPIRGITSKTSEGIFTNGDLADFFFNKLPKVKKDSLTGSEVTAIQGLSEIIEDVVTMVYPSVNIKGSTLTNVADNIYYAIVSCFGSPEDVALFEKQPNTMATKRDNFLSADAKALAQKKAEKLEKQRRAGGRTTSGEALTHPVPNIFAAQVSSVLNLSVTDDNVTSVNLLFKSLMSIFSPSQMDSKDAINSIGGLLNSDVSADEFKKSIFESFRTVLTRLQYPEAANEFYLTQDEVTKAKQSKLKNTAALPFEAQKALAKIKDAILALTDEDITKISETVKGMKNLQAYNTEVNKNLSVPEEDLGELLSELGSLIDVIKQHADEEDAQDAEELISKVRNNISNTKTASIKDYNQLKYVVFYRLDVAQTSQTAFQPILNKLYVIRDIIKAPTDEEMTGKQVAAQEDIYKLVSDLSDYKIKSGASINASRSRGFDLLMLPYKGIIDQSQALSQEPVRAEKRKRVEALQKEGDEFTADITKDFDKKESTKADEEKRKQEEDRMKKFLLPGEAFTGEKIFTTPNEHKKLMAASLQQVESKAKYLYNSIYSKLKGGELLDHIKTQGVDEDNQLAVEELIIKDFMNPGGPVEQFFKITHRPSEISSAFGKDEDSVTIAKDKFNYLMVMTGYKKLAPEQKKSLAFEVLVSQGNEDITDEAVNTKVENLNKDFESNTTAVAFSKDTARKEEFDIIKNIIWESHRLSTLHGSNIPSVRAFLSVVSNSIKTGTILTQAQVVPSASNTFLDPKTYSFINLVSSIERFDNLDSFILNTSKSSVDTLSFIFDVANYPAFLHKDRANALATKFFILNHLKTLIINSNLISLLDDSVIKVYEEDEKNIIVNKVWHDSIMLPIRDDLDPDGTLNFELETTKSLLKSVIKGNGNTVSPVDMYGEGSENNPSQSLDINDENALNDFILSQGISGLNALKGSNKAPTQVKRFLSACFKPKESPDNLANMLRNTLFILESGVSYAVARQVLLANKVDVDTIKRLDNNNGAFLSAFKSTGIGSKKVFKQDDSGIENIKNIYLTSFINEFNFLFSAANYKQADEEYTEKEAEFSKRVAISRNQVLFNPEIPNAILGVCKLSSSRVAYSDETSTNLIKEILSGSPNSAVAKKLINKIKQQNKKQAKKESPEFFIQTPDAKFKLLVPSDVKITAPVDITKEAMTGQVMGMVTKDSLNKSVTETTSVSEFYTKLSRSSEELGKLLTSVSSLWGGEVSNELSSFTSNVQIACANMQKAMKVLYSDGKDRINDPASQKLAIEILQGSKSPIISKTNPFAFIEYDTVSETSTEAQDIEAGLQVNAVIRPSLKTVDPSSGKMVPHFNSTEVVAMLHGMCSLLSKMTVDEIMTKASELYGSVEEKPEEPVDEYEQEHEAEEETPEEVKEVKPVFNVDSSISTLRNLILTPSHLGANTIKDIDVIINSIDEQLRTAEEPVKKNIRLKLVGMLTWLSSRFLANVENYKKSINKDQAEIYMGSNITPILEKKPRILVLAGMLDDNGNQRSHLDSTINAPEPLEFPEVKVVESILNKNLAILNENIKPLDMSDLEQLLLRYKGITDNADFETEIKPRIIQDLKKFVPFFVMDSSIEYKEYLKAKSANASRCLLVSSMVDETRRVETAISCGNLQMILDFVNQSNFNKGDADYYQFITKGEND